MLISAFAGKWKLIAWAKEKSENTFKDNRPSKSTVQIWLNSNNMELANNPSEGHGLVLEITSDGNFTENKTDEPDIDWYDEEGVLSNQVKPYNGKLIESDSGFYILPNNVPSFGSPKDEKSEAKLRYDDGDTKICEILEFLSNFSQISNFRL
jgi:hypothetical protein